MKHRDLLALTCLVRKPTILTGRALLQQAASLSELSGMSSQFAFPEHQAQKALQWADDMLGANKEQDIHLVSFLDNDYPPSLRKLSDAPPLLYYQGYLTALNQPTIALIGSRQITERTKVTGKLIADYLVANKFVLVSGLALGSDTLAHQASVDAQQPTVAVMAGGLDHVTPVSNQALATKILRCQGLLITETPTGTLPTKQDFVLRNRIITALSSRVIILQAAQKSGTMHAARFATAQQRPLCCLKPVSHPQDAYSGNSYLIRTKKAQMLESMASLKQFIQPRPVGLKQTGLRPSV